MVNTKNTTSCSPSASKSKAYETRDAIADIWGPRTPYKHEWPTRVDERLIDEPEKWVQSACVFCSNGCGLDIGVKNGKVVGVRGRATDRVNKGRLGPKGLNGWTAISHPDRLKYPLVRKNGKLERVSWDEAMNVIVQRVKQTQARLSNHGIGFYTSGQLFLEEYFVLATIGKAGLNTLHMDGNTRLCTATAAASMRESFGSDGQPGSYTDIDYTDCLFMVGHNVSNTQTVLWSRMLDRLDGPNPPELIVVDPRRSDTAKRATVHLAPKIGTNMALLNGIQHLLFANDWVDEEFVSKHVVGLEQLKKTVEKYTPEHVEEITGVPQSQLKEAARIIGTTKSLLSTALQGVYQSNQATASACQINNINLLRGLIGKPGSGILQMNGQPTAQNNRESGCDGEYPAFRNFQNPKHVQEIADVWNIDVMHVPHWAQPTHVSAMLKHIEHGSIDIMWISGTNPLVSLPHLQQARDLFTKPDLFVICQDIYMTETAAIADVVLPCAQWGEKTGCFTNVDRTVHLSHKAVEPPGEAKPDMAIFLDFAKRMDFKDKDGNDLCPWSEPEEGTERLFTDGKFFTGIEHCESYGHDLETGAPMTKAQYESFNPAGRAILKAAEYRPPLETPDEEYPFRLSTGRNVYHFHTRTKTGRNERLQRACPEAVVQISHEDAQDLQLKEKDMVVVRSRRGAIELPVVIGNIEKGQVFIPFHFGYFDAKDERARAANELTIEQWDPISKQPSFKSGAVKIEKIDDQEPGTVKIHARQRQSEAIHKVETTPKPTANMEQGDQFKRRLTPWLSSTHDALNTLVEIYDELVPKLVQDLDIQSGLRLMCTITHEIIDHLQPYIEKYHDNQRYSAQISWNLRDSLFSLSRGSDSFRVITTLQAVDLFVTYIDGYLIALKPASMALWDKGFVDAVDFAQAQLARQQAWVRSHLKTKSPQTLLVPVPVEEDLECERQRTS
uniref:Nitrate reductase n=1 Tax=Talaromyces marneffei PM1 TaxID=1077442 RepID=A0A093XDL3_TALMA